MLALASLICVGVLQVFAAAECSPFGFDLAPGVRFGRIPYAMVVSDFNGDSRSDFAITHGGSISTLIDNGAGGYTPNNFALNQSGDADLVAADFNHDDVADLAAVNPGNGSVSILLGIGSGGFFAPHHFQAGTTPYSIDTGDFNRDGNLDVVTEGGTTLSILLGDGAGNFGVPTNYPLASGSISLQSVVVGHFNADTNLDVVSINGTNVSLRAGDGMGALGPATNFALGSGIAAIEMGRFNNDNNPDLVVLNNGDVSILLGDGVGGFAPAINTPTPDSSRSVAVGDFDNDGNQDLAVTDKALTILLGDGAGNFDAPVNYVPGGKTNFVVTGNLDNDTATDVAVLYQEVAQNTVSIFHGKGDGSFDSVMTDFAAVGARPNFIATSDFNMDGKPDLAVSNEESDNVSVLLGDGAGSFGAASNFAVGERPYSLVVSDFNNDQKADLATANIDSANVSILLGDGMGGFAAATNFNTGTLPRFIAVADYNSDGKLDLAVTRFINSSTGRITILPGDGMGGFGAPNDIFVPYFAGFILAHDFNNDNKADLVVAAEYGSQVSILLGNGMGGFGVSNDHTVTFNPKHIVVGDFNHDGKSDIAVANSLGFISILLGDGMGGLSPTTNYPSSNSFSSNSARAIALATGDFNRDGEVDIAVANYGSITDDNVAILRGDGTGAFSPPHIIDTGKDARFIVAEDFNGDGKPDLVIANFMNDSIQTLFNNAASTSELSITKTDSPDPLLVGQNVTYTSIVTNNGLSPDTGVVAVDQLPPGMTFISASSTVGSCVRASRIVTCNIGILADGASATIQITVRPNAPGEFSNRINVRGDNCDLNAENNEAFEVTTAVKLLSFVLSPRTVSGCQRVTATLTLSGPAPAGGVIVTLSDTIAALDTPPAVTIPAGATSRTFMISTTPVNAAEDGIVTAKLGTVTISKPLTVRPIGVQTLTLNPNPVTGPHAVTGFVTLECPAPAGGITVALSSSNPGVAAPTVSSVNIPAGLKSRSFTVRTADVPSPRSAIIKATANGISKSVTLTVN